MSFLCSEEPFPGVLIIGSRFQSIVTFGRRFRGEDRGDPYDIDSFGRYETGRKSFTTSISVKVSDVPVYRRP